MSEAITFQVAFESASSRFSQRDLLLAEDARLRRQRRLHVRAVGAAIGAQVEEEHVEQRTVGDLAVDPAGLGRRDSGSASSRGRRGRRGPTAAQPTSRYSGRPWTGPSTTTSCWSPRGRPTGRRSGRRALSARQCSSIRLYFHWPRYSSSVSATFASRRSATLFFHLPPPGSSTSAFIGAVGIDGVARMQEEVRACAWRWWRRSACPSRRCPSPGRRCRPTRRSGRCGFARARCGSGRRSARTRALMSARSASVMR